MTPGLEIRTGRHLCSQRIPGTALSGPPGRDRGNPEPPGRHESPLYRELKGPENVARVAANFEGISAPSAHCVSAAAAAFDLAATVAVPAAGDAGPADRDASVYDWGPHGPDPARRSECGKVAGKAGGCCIQRERDNVGIGEQEVDNGAHAEVREGEDDCGILEGHAGGSPALRRGRPQAF